jgi:hypothetical protein
MGRSADFFAGVLFFDILDGGGEIFFGRVFFRSLPFGAVGNPPSRVGAEFVFGFEPCATSLRVFGAVFFHHRNPFFERPARCRI